MQYQLIQNFLQLPGIIGFSLIPLDPDNSLEQACSVGLPEGQGSEQQFLLLQGIQQIISTTPASLEFCMFQFGSHQVELHKVESRAVLLVLSEGPLSSDYSKAVSELMQFIKADYSALVESIRGLRAEAEDKLSELSTPVPTARLGDVVAAMNSLNLVTSRYLGPQLVANHWRTFQEAPWLNKFSIDADGTVSVLEQDQQLSPEQLAEIRLWTQRFHQRCTRIIRDYDTLLEQALPAHYRQLLFGQ